MNLPTLAKSQCKLYIVTLKFNAIVCSELASISTELTILVRANASVSQKKSIIIRAIERRDIITPIFVAYFCTAGEKKLCMHAELQEKDGRLQRWLNIPPSSLWGHVCKSR